MIQQLSAFGNSKLASASLRICCTTVCKPCPNNDGPAVFVALQNTRPFDACLQENPTLETLLFVQINEGNDLGLSPHQRGCPESSIVASEPPAWWHQPGHSAMFMCAEDAILIWIHLYAWRLVRFVAALMYMHAGLDALADILSSEVVACPAGARGVLVHPSRGGEGSANRKQKQLLAYFRPRIALIPWSFFSYFLSGMRKSSSVFAVQCGGVLPLPHCAGEGATFPS